MTSLPSPALMALETRVCAGIVPHDLGGEPLRERSWLLAGDTFLMRGDGEHYLHYRRGQGIVVERGPGSDLAYEPLWLAGTMHAAIACLNGLIPIHASAVAHDGRVYAFTGASGAGKSTLIAALGRLGLPMVCDDTLVLDPAQDPLLCLPGHKRLKLTAEASRATGAIAQEAVGPDIAKVYAVPPAGDIAEPLPLAALLVLADGEAPALAPIVGGAKVRVLLADHYTVDLLAAASGQHGPRALFERIAVLAGRVTMLRLTRPRDLARLGETAMFVADWIEQWGAGCQTQ